MSKSRKKSIPNCFSNEHRTIRRSHRLTQQMESELAGDYPSHSQISKYECGENLPPHAAVVEELAEAMNCTYGEKQRLLKAYARAKAERDGTDSQLAA